MLFAVHVTVTPVCAPAASTRDSGNADVRAGGVVPVRDRNDAGGFGRVHRYRTGAGELDADGPRAGRVVLTFSATGVAVRTRAWLVPVTVSQDDDAGAPLAIVTVIVDVPGPIRNDGLKETVALAGWPLALRSTRSAKPLSSPIVTRNVAVPPGGITRVAGVTVTVKSAGQQAVDGDLVVLIRQEDTPVRHDRRHELHQRADAIA